MKNIVLIDDENDILEIIKSSLELIISEHICYHTFSDPIQAVRFIQENEVDIVITDLNMSKLNGVEVYQKLKINSKVRHFIFLSGHIADFQNDLSKINNCHVLEKPIQVEKLGKLIEDCLINKENKKSKKWLFF